MKIRFSPVTIIGEDDYFLVEGNTYDILLLMTKPSVWNLPASVEAKVIEAPDALAR